MAETTTLPADPEKTGNVWCDACQQSLPASRAATHLGSKKHQQKTETGVDGGEPKRARARGAKARAGAEAEELDAEPAPSAEPKATRGAGEKRAGKRAATPGGLIADPNKAGNYWCGICSVSLTPTKAEGHAATARHQENERRTLTSAMRTLRVDGK